MLFLPYQVDLKPIELEIYHYIVQNLDKVIYMRIRDLADATHVSTTTILRFCKKFDCNGFSDFKLKLQMYVDEQNQQQQEIKRADELPYIEFLRRTSTPNFQHLIHESAILLNQADLVLTVGIGTSNHMAAYASMLYSSILTLALHISDPLNMPLQHIPTFLNKRICLVVLSVSGENEDLIHYINDLKRYQASIISITNSANATISKLSDINIPYYTNTEMYQDTNITSQLPVTYILESIGRHAHRLKTFESQ